MANNIDKNKELSFASKLQIIGVNPYVILPKNILRAIFLQAKKSKGHIPIKGKINDVPYKQTLVKYKGYYRLYVNTFMLKNSPKRIGKKLKITVQFDEEDRTVPMHPRLEIAFKKEPRANAVFESLSPSRRKEILRYMHALKNEASVNRNIERAINFLLGKERFVGRDKP
jgi:hypothetical protein